MQMIAQRSIQPSRHRPAALLAGAGFLLVACAGALAQTPPPANTDAKITVAPASGPSPGGTCTTTSGFFICVDKDPVPTPAVPVGTSVQITWTLSGANWTWVRNNKGIDIQNPKDWKTKQESPIKFIATNKKEAGARYKYDVNVTNGTVTLKWDPSIMN
jgi:hypothetical protein